MNVFLFPIFSRWNWIRRFKNNFLWMYVFRLNMGKKKRNGWYYHHITAEFSLWSAKVVLKQIFIRQGSRSWSQNYGKKAKIHNFLEIVQYTCNTTIIYQNLMGNPKNNKNTNLQVFSLLYTFFMTIIWSAHIKIYQKLQSFF